MLTCYAVQIETPVAQPLYPNGTVAVPRTVLIPSAEILRSVSRDKLFRDSRNFSVFHLMGGQLPEERYNWGDRTSGLADLGEAHFDPNVNQSAWGLEVPGDVIYNWGLKEGDEVILAVSKPHRLVFIASVNGQQDPMVCQKWPDFDGLQADYPKCPLPVEKYGDPDLRVVTLLAPVGKGQGYFIAAPGGAGKSWLLAKFFRELAKLTVEDETLHVICGFVGDRPADFPVYERIAQSSGTNRVELYQSNWADDPKCQVSMARFIAKRAHRLVTTGKNVVLLFDSISRAVTVHSSLSDRQGSIVPGGVYWESIFQMIPQLLGKYGYFNDRMSLTLIGTVLAGSDDIRTIERVVFQETANSIPSGICTLMSNPTLDRPRVSVNGISTFTRYPLGSDFRTSSQAWEMAAVQELMWAPFQVVDESGNPVLDKQEKPIIKPPWAELAHKRLIEYAEKHPVPAYFN